MAPAVDPLSDGPARTARLIFGASLVPSILLALFTAARDPRYGVVAVLLGVGLGTLWGLATRLESRGLNPGWLLTLASLNLVLLTPELALRAAGFRYESGIEFGYPRPSHFIAFEPHPTLFWTLRPGSEGVNSWGFPGLEITLPKPEGVERILVLGDSCSQSGYPTKLEQMLNDGVPAGRPSFEVVILAIAGYSSYQGRELAEQHAKSLGADLALVYYGWNDHWRAWGEPDASKVVPLPGSAINTIYARLLRRSRFIGFLEWLRDGLRGEQRAVSNVFRVPAARYRENLERIETAFEEAGTQVVFLTAPTSYYRFGVPRYVVEAALARSGESAVALHREYNEIVRVVAAEGDAVLFDLERRFDSLSDEALQEIFLPDGIHFSPEGHRRVAGEIEAFLRERRMLGGADART